VCVKSNSRLQYNSLGFRRVNNDDEDFSDEEEYYYGQSSKIKDWAPKAASKAAKNYRDDSLSSDEGEEENSLFEKRLLRQ
jgi:hypothetical protein